MEKETDMILVLIICRKRTPSINDLQSIGIIPVPYTWMSQIQTSQNAPTQTSERFAPASVLHPNQSLYLVTVAKNNSQTDNNVLVYHNHMKKAGLLILSKLWLT